MTDNSTVKSWDLDTYKENYDRLMVIAKRLTPLETQHISLGCVESRGHDGAWGEAVARLRLIYDAQRKHNPTASLSLAILRDQTADRARRRNE